MIIVERRLFDGVDVFSPICALLISAGRGKRNRAISINLGTGCKSRREIVFSCKDVRGQGQSRREEAKKGLDIPCSSLGFPGAELFGGIAARIKASCGIKNLCNQLSNLLPHISRPMSRHPRRRL